ncbi:hypothetical protein QVD17_19932 [Tagetes erecta]|uniref:Cathepsin propeptide inhibitor domain-containing protein n=1 Tax=Tagetes erecta TaxID=13708 RepID=A0AAD8KKT7_TARER|nr:hypothetical protein QVD17_19932 [Tagetes erecta]
MALVCNKSVPLRRLLWTRGIADYSRGHISDDDLKALFEEWAIHNHKHYKSVKQKEWRFMHFRKCFEFVVNGNISQPFSTLGLNDFSDYTREELDVIMGDAHYLTKE